MLIATNTQDLILAEVEGDALFFSKEAVPSLEKLLAQIETMFTTFSSRLKLSFKIRSLFRIWIYFSKNVVCIGY
ncbi:DUF2652 domain-containing protein [Urechidicola sp. KH5]